MDTLMLVVLWVALAFQLFMDANGDGLRQADEAGAAGVDYSVTWVDGDLSSVMIGTSLADGSIVTNGEGAVTLAASCAYYSARMDEVVGQVIIDLPCVWLHHAYLPYVGSAS